MRHDIIDRQAQAMNAARPRCDPFVLSRELRLRHRFPVADPEADAVAPRHGAGDGRRHGGARGGRHGGEHHSGEGGRGHRDRGVARVRVRSDEGRRRSPAPARPCRRRASASSSITCRPPISPSSPRCCRRRNSSPRRRCWRGCARSRPRTRSTSCAGSPASPTAVSPRHLARSAPARPRWTSPPRSPAASTSRARSPSR